MAVNGIAVRAALIGLGLFAASPLLPRLAARLPRPPQKEQALIAELPVFPSIDVVVPSYLEAGVIGEKVSGLRKALASWPGQSRVVVVASDPETASAASAADVVVETAREGKAAACNRGVAVSNADVVVLTDANCEIGPSDWPARAILHLRRSHLVSGNKHEIGGAEGAFWALERKTKASGPADIGTLAVAGEFLAFRRADYTPIASATNLDDLSIALSFARRGLRVTVAPDVSTVEEAVVGRDQWGRRLRIVQGLFVEVVPLLPVLLRSGSGRVFVAHKLYRTTVGCLGFWLFAASATVAMLPYSLVTLAALGYLIRAYHTPRGAPTLLGHLATVVGLQTVPPVALVGLVGNRKQREGWGLWAKIPR